MKLISRIVLVAAFLISALSVASAQQVPTEASAAELHKAGYSALESKQFERAVTLLKRVTELQPKHRYAWNNLGRAYRGLERYEEAVECFRKAIELDPFEQYAYNNMAMSLQQLGKAKEAEAAFRKQIEVNPLDKWAHKNLARMLMDQSRFQEAIEFLDTASRLSPDDKSILMLMGFTYSKLGDEEKGKEFLRRGQEDGLPKGWFIPVDPLVKKLRESGEPGAALIEARKRVDALHKALSEMSMSAPSEQDRKNSGLMFEEWAIIGDAYLRKGDLTKAEKYLAASFAWRDSGIVAERLAQIYEKTGRKEKAIEYFQRAVFSVQPYADGQFGLARVLGSTDASDAAIRENRMKFEGAKPTWFEVASAKQGAAIYSLSFAGSDLRDVSFMGGDQMPPEVAKALAEQKIAVEFPDEARPKLLRPAIVFCTPLQCSFMLQIPLGLGGKDMIIEQRKPPALSQEPNITVPRK